MKVLARFENVIVVLILSVIFLSSVSLAQADPNYVFSLDTSTYYFLLQNGNTIRFSPSIIYLDNLTYGYNLTWFWHLSTGNTFSPNIGWETSNNLTIISLDSTSGYNTAEFNVTGLNGQTYLVNVWCGNQGLPLVVYLNNINLSENYSFNNVTDILSIWSTLHLTPHNWELVWSNTTTFTYTPPVTTTSTTTTTTTTTTSTSSTSSSTSTSSSSGGNSNGGSTTTYSTHTTSIHTTTISTNTENLHLSHSLSSTIFVYIMMGVCVVTVILVVRRKGKV